MNARESLFCHCCGATVNRCTCEFAEFFVMEGGDAAKPGRYERHCVRHDVPWTTFDPREEPRR